MSNETKLIFRRLSFRVVRKFSAASNVYGHCPCGIIAIGAWPRCRLRRKPEHLFTLDPQRVRCKLFFSVAAENVTHRNDVNEVQCHSHHLHHHHLQNLPPTHSREQQQKGSSSFLTLNITALPSLSISWRIKATRLAFLT